MKFKVNDKVFCIIRQECGKVTRTNPDAPKFHAVKVSFEDGLTHTYSVDGFFRSTDQFPSLYHRIPKIVDRGGAPEKQFTIKIYRDSDSNDDPRNWDNFGTMFCKHRKYCLGDSDAYDIREEDDKGYLHYPEGYLVLPLYLYDLGGFTMRTTPFSCGWDSGRVGYIYTSYDKIREEFGEITPELLTRVEGYLKDEVKTYDQYLKGEVYWFEKIDNFTGECVDSCGRFFGHDFEENGLFDQAGYKEEDCLIEKVGDW